jgi:predicted RNase H-like HicB family nuclease
MPFPYRMIIEWSQEAEAYVATVPELDATADGDTPASALRKVIVVAMTAMELGPTQTQRPDRALK